MEPQRTHESQPTEVTERVATAESYGHGLPTSTPLRSSYQTMVEKPSESNSDEDTDNESSPDEDTDNESDAHSMVSTYLDGYDAMRDIRESENELQEYRMDDSGVLSRMTIDNQLLRWLYPKLRPEIRRLAKPVRLTRDQVVPGMVILKIDHWTAQSDKLQRDIYAANRRGKPHPACYTLRYRDPQTGRPVAIPRCVRVQPAVVECKGPDYYLAHSICTYNNQGLEGLSEDQRLDHVGIHDSRKAEKPEPRYGRLPLLTSVLCAWVGPLKSNAFVKLSPSSEMRVKYVEEVIVCGALIGPEVDRLRHLSMEAAERFWDSQAEQLAAEQPTRDSRYHELVAKRMKWRYDTDAEKDGPAIGQQAEHLQDSDSASTRPYSSHSTSEAPPQVDNTALPPHKKKQGTKRTFAEFSAAYSDEQGEDATSDTMQSAVKRVAVGERSDTLSQTSGHDATDIVATGTFSSWIACWLRWALSGTAPQNQEPAQQ